MSVRDSAEALRWLRALVLGLLISISSACRASRVYVPQPSRYDSLPRGGEEVLHEARRAFDEGRRADAHAALLSLVQLSPSNIPVRIFLQDVRLSLLEAGEAASGFDFGAVPNPEAWLFEAYLNQADANPSPEVFVLAARLAPDGETALELLDEAGRLDPRCPWVHYGRGYWLQELGQVPEARGAVRTALRIDGGHPPSMRLFGSMLASAGDTTGAIEVLELWVRRAESSPLVTRGHLAEARVDLAALHVLDDEPEEALQVMDMTDFERLRDPALGELVSAAAYAATGEFERALLAARRARELDPTSYLPLVHEALVLQREGSSVSERVVWEELLERIDADPPRPSESSSSPVDFQALLLEVQARARLERLDRMERRGVEARDTFEP